VGGDLIKKGKKKGLHPILYEGEKARKKGKIKNTTNGSKKLSSLEKGTTFYQRH